MALAGRAARSVAEGGELHDADEPEPDDLPRHSTVAIDPRSVAVERKVGLLRRANEVARGLDQRIHQVTASYGESVQEVLIANSDGLFRTDTRVRLNMAVHAVAKYGEILESGFEAIRGTAGFEMLTDEAERMRRYQGLGFRGPDHSRRAWVIGSPLDVWEVVEAWQDLGQDEAAIKQHCSLNAHPRVRWPRSRGRSQLEGPLGLLRPDRREGRERADHGDRRRHGSG